MKHAPVALDTLCYIGKNLQRPECVLTTSNGDVFTSHWNGGITQIKPTGQQINYLAKEADIAIKPNGFAITQQHTFLVANLGNDGGIWELTKNGELRPFLSEIDGTTIPPANYVTIDSKNRVWISISTSHTPRELAYKKDICDGFIVCVDARGARVVASGLAYTNEIQMSPCQDFLYCNETFGQKLSRFAILSNGSLGKKELVTEFSEDTFPDGLCFDEHHNTWVTSIISNKVICVSRGGSQQLILEDYNDEHVLLAKNAFAINGLLRMHLDNTPAQYLKNTSSLAFGGPHRNIAYLGCLLDDKIAYFKTNVKGLKPYHWDFSL